MRLPKTLLTVLSIVVLLFSTDVFLISSANAKENISKRIRFHSLTVEDGLSQSSIYVISEDRLGYMWFGTQDGLNRYDGSSFDRLRHSSKDVNSLVSPTVLDLKYDSQDTMWVHTPQGIDSVDIYSLKITHWTEHLAKLLTPEEKAEASLNVLSMDLTSNNRELYILTERFVALINTETKAVQRLNRFEPLFDADDKLKSILVFNQRLYLLQDNCLLSVGFDGRDRSSYCLSSDLELLKLKENNKKPQSFFVVGTEGFAVYDGDNEALSYFEVLSSRTSGPVKIYSVLSYKNGYWLATESGLKYWSSDEAAVTHEFFADFSDHDSINNNYILSLWESIDGFLWAGNSVGVNYWEPEQQFVHLLQKHEVMRLNQTNYTTSLLKTYQGDLLIGTAASGIFKYNDDFSILEHYTPIKVGEDFVSTGYVAGMVEDRHRNLWYITNTGLFFKPFGREGFSLLKEVHDVEGNLLNLRDLSSIIEARNGDIWVGGEEGFFQIKVNQNSLSLNSSKLEFINHSDVIPKEVMEAHYGVYTIYEDLQGYLWIGGSKGAVRFDPINENVELFQSVLSDPQTLSNSDVTVIYEDLLGVLWIGTVSGLNRVRYNSKGNVYFQRVTENDGFVNDFICSILADSSGYLWISTANGLVKYHPDKGIPINFTYQDGLQYSEFFTNADFVDELGNLYFGGINGITMLNPNEISIDKEEKELKITSIRQSETVMPFTREGNTYFANVQDDGVVTIRLSTFDFINGRQSDYRYKIDSFDEQWVMLDKPFIRLHNLSQEQLLVRTQIRQKDGLWGDKETVLLLSINKSFWASAQGFMLYLLILTLVVIGVAIYLSRYFSRRLSLQDKKLKERKAQTQLLLSEKKTLLYQVEDLQYSLSEQRYLSERLEGQLKNQLANDQLTGFKSKHYLKQHIGKELESITATWIENDGIAGVYLGVFAVDIDNLAMINKEHGHLCGNEVLKQAAECLRIISYGSDTLVRWQGATLLVLNRGIEKREQMILAEKIRSIIASRKFDLGNGASIDVTCSVGFGHFPFLQNPNETITWEQLIYVINRALSVAKNNSRNAWLGIYTNQFSHPQEVRAQITTNLSGLLASGQLDYVSSIPKSNKIDWDSD